MKLSMEGGWIEDANRTFCALWQRVSAYQPEYRIVLIKIPDLCKRLEWVTPTGAGGINLLKKV